VHGPAADERCRHLLDAAGFELVPSRALEESRRAEWRSDPDLFCIGPECESRERDLALLRAAGF